MNVKKIFYRLSVLLIGGALAVSCYSEDSGLTTSGSSTEVAYDPSQPIVLDTFYPDSGGMATAVILKGENFGTDISKIRVWYSQKQAAVVNSSGDRIYVITPKQPGDINTISVVVSADGTFEDADSVVFDQTFEYTTSYTVSTLAGKQSAYNTLDGSLASAEFYLPRYLTVDNEKNVFVSDCWGCYFRFVNEESDIVSSLSWLAYPNAPSLDAAGEVVFVPIDDGNTMYEFDPDTQWAAKKITPRQAEDDTVGFDIDWKHSLAINMDDELMYTRAYNGQIIKFNTTTKSAWRVGTELFNASSDSYMMFHPTDLNLLYICYCARSCIYTIDVTDPDNTHELYAGQQNITGYADGDRLEALFTYPRQILFTEDGTLYVADGGNHCIRSISPEGLVTTVVGLPGISGFRDGNPEIALFNWCDGVAVDSDGIIYIADMWNCLIRKLSIE